MELDESWFGKERYGRQAIVIGAIEQGSGRIKVEILPSAPDADLVQGFLERHVTPSTLVVTDTAGYYAGIEWMGYGREIWNHSKGHFTGTNRIENLWSRMKRRARRILSHVGMTTARLQVFLNEWMARCNQAHVFRSPQAYLRATLFRFS